MNRRPELLRETICICVIRQPGLHSRFHTSLEPFECLHAKLLVSSLRPLQLLRTPGHKNQLVFVRVFQPKADIPLEGLLQGIQRISRPPPDLIELFD